MAFSIQCKRCGWEETPHELKHEFSKEDGVNTIFEGRTHSLAECKKFLPERKLTKEEQKELERDELKEQQISDYW